jgi:1-acyl-sn-glycerol-3-phosphate acyltransferase
VIALVRSLVYALFFYVGSTLIVVGGAIAGLVSRRALQFMSWLWSRWFRICARAILGVRMRIEGDIPAGSVLFALKHEAAYETLLVLSLFDRPATVIKGELRRVPVWGWVAERHGAIFVDRQARSAALRDMLKRGAAAKAEKRPVVIFPEGTRVAVGARPPLAAGFAGLYKMLGLPVVPVALDSGRIWPKGLIKHAGTVTLRFGAPIPPGLPRDEIEARVHGFINQFNEAA